MAPCQMGGANGFDGIGSLYVLFRVEYETWHTCNLSDSEDQAIDLFPAVIESQAD